MLLLLWPRENFFLLPCPVFVRKARSVMELIQGETPKRAWNFQCEPRNSGFIHFSVLVYSFNSSWKRFFLCEWVLKIPQWLETSKPAGFDGSLHPGCCPFLSSWKHLPGHRRVVQLGASGGLYYRESKMGVLAPKSIIWDDIWMQKLLFMGFVENHPPM